MIQGGHSLGMNANRKRINKLSNGTVFNNLERPLYPDFKITPLFDAEYLRHGIRDPDTVIKY